MSNLKPPIPGTSVAEILARVKISEVYCVLSGKRPRPVGPNAWRGQAVWRGGDGHNVSLNDTRNVWHGFTANNGYRFKSRKKVETTLIAAPLSLIVNPKKAI